MTAVLNDTAATPTRNGLARLKPSEVVLEYEKSDVDLKAFKDESSSYGVLSKLCLQIAQRAGNPEPIVHDIKFKECLVEIFDHLIHCVLNHTDRTCRILCIQTLAVTGRSGYARIRPSALLYSIRETNSTYLEDLIGSDVPTCLANVILDDPDDGVASAALSGLGLLILNNNHLFNSFMEDELALHIQGILGKSLYAPTLRSVTDEDPSIAISELQSRVIENVLSPRLLQMLHRVIGFEKQNYIARAIPVLSCALDHMKNVHYPAVDKATFSKRWPEVDVAGLTTLYETKIICPLLNSVSGHCAFTAAMASLKLRQTDHVPAILRNEIAATTITETKHVLIATYLVAVRNLPISVRDLVWLADEIRELPSTVMSANNIGILMRDGSRRLPARITLWTELALQYFLDGPYKGKPEALAGFLDQSWIHDSSASVLSVSDEILFAFTNVAIYTGRKSRASEHVDDWVVLAELVLRKFIHPRNVDNMSLQTAGWASYIQLLQEYLNTIDQLQPGASVALKLVSNACPPHILWDNLSSSAQYLARSDSGEVRIEPQANAILDVWVTKELNSKKQTLIHPMRLFLLALAGDHWVQTCATNLRRQDKKEGLNLSGARDIQMALAPKRLLSKLAAEQEPVQKIAVETVRVGVACIENIALAACLWRRSFGSSSDTKQIVSTSVGLLQGKVDETPVEEWMVGVMGPICESAVGRIQAFYESAGSNLDPQSFPLSELLAQPVKIKIKPLVSSSSKPSNQELGDEFRREYLMQACRQMVDLRIQLAMQSNPTAGLSGARPQDPLRLAVPPLPESMDGRLYGFRGEAMSAWGHNVNAASAASDPAQVITAITPKRYLRYDGQDEYRISIMMRAYNMTAIDFDEGLRLEFGLASCDSDDGSFTKELIASLDCKLEDLSLEAPLVSSSSNFDKQLKPGECITWEVDLENVAVSNSLKLTPSIVFLNLRVEPEDAGATWVGEKPSEGSTVSESQNGEDDFHVTTDGTKTFEGKSVMKEDVKLTGEPLVISPLMLFQPCPFVFYTDRCGDTDSFRFWWFRFPYHLAPIAVTEETTQRSEPNPITRKIARMSSLTWEGEAIPGGVATQLWAFMSLSGSRVFCVLTETSDKSGQIQLKLYFRGDNRLALHSFVGSKASRKSVVTSLLPGMCTAR